MQHPPSLIDSMTTIDKLDAATFWLLNLSSCFMLSAAHNVLYFVLDIRTPVLHFMHFACTFIFLLIKLVATQRSDFFRRRRQLIPPRPLRLFAPVIVAQGIVTALSGFVHAQNRAGGVYLIRLFDFLTTFTVLRLVPALLGSDEALKQRKIWSLLIPVALSGSLSWLEFGHVEFDQWTLAFAPFLAVAQGVQLVLLRKTQIKFHSAISQKNEHCYKNSASDDGRFEFEGWEDGNDLDVYFEWFALYYTGLAMVVLTVPAMISYAGSVVPYDASWESIDYLLMSMSVVFMCGYKYSELWMLAHFDLHNFCALEHTKFWMASCGQWFLQNMAHATVYAACGKAIFLASLFRYAIRIIGRDLTAGWSWNKKHNVDD